MNPNIDFISFICGVALVLSIGVLIFIVYTLIKDYKELNDIEKDLELGRIKEKQFYILNEINYLYCKIDEIESIRDFENIDLTKFKTKLFKDKYLKETLYEEYKKLSIKATENMRMFYKWYLDMLKQEQNYIKLKEQEKELKKENAKSKTTNKVVKE